jgi:hypothetical protein
LNASPNPTAVSNDSSLNLYVTSSGSPLSNATVQWSASAGTIFNASSSTNTNGTASAMYRAGSNASSVQIQAKVSKPGYFTYLANLTDDVFVPTLSVENFVPQNIRGGDNASIAIQVSSEGHVIPNASVSWQIMSGPVTGLSGRPITNSSGYSSAILSTARSAGAAEIQAEVSKSGLPNYTDDIQLEVTLLNMTVQVLEPHPSIIENYKSAFSILVTSLGAPIDNASVTGSATGGTLESQTTSTNGTGYASAIFESGSQPGNMSVHALISKLGYYNYSETIYIVVVVPSLVGPSQTGVGSKNILMLDVGNVIPVWALIVIAGGAAGGFFFYKRKKNAGVYYEEE